MIAFGFGGQVEKKTGQIILGTDSLHEGATILLDRKNLKNHEANCASVLFYAFAGNFPNYVTETAAAKHFSSAIVIVSNDKPSFCRPNELDCSLSS